MLQCSVTQGSIYSKTKYGSNKAEFHNSSNVFEKLYQKILETQPTHPDANHNLGVLKVLLNKSADALLLFKIAVESNPSIEQYWYSYSNTLIREKKLEEALEKLNLINPQNLNLKEKKLVNRMLQL